MTARDATQTRRKKPRQRRAQQTVEVILEATAQLLRQGGLEAATTNRIAERAGVSIGSVYQYYPNKQALIGALIDRHRDAMMGVLVARFEGVGALPPAEAVPVLVSAVVEMHRADPVLHRILSEQAAPLGRASQRQRDVDVVARAMTRAYLEAHRGEIEASDCDVAAYVVVQMVDALAHSAVVNGGGGLEVEVLSTEVVRAVLRYLGVR